MAKTLKDYSKQIQKMRDVINNNPDIYRLSHVWLYVPFGKGLWYDGILVADKTDTIKKEIEELLELNRLRAKEDLRRRFIASDNPILQLASYKLLADEDEIERLTIQKNNNKNEHSGEIKIVQVVRVPNEKPKDKK